MIYKDICVATEKYTDSTGKEKNRYQTVGIACFDDNGSIKWQKLFKTFNPAGVPNECYLNFFDKERKNNSQLPQAPAPADDVPSSYAPVNQDDIPF